jgi:hypothetical protein
VLTWANAGTKRQQYIGYDISWCQVRESSLVSQRPTTFYSICLACLRNIPRKLANVRPPLLRVSPALLDLPVPFSCIRFCSSSRPTSDRRLWPPRRMFFVSSRAVWQQHHEPESLHPGPRRCATMSLSDALFLPRSYCGYDETQARSDRTRPRPACRIPG